MTGAPYGRVKDSKTQASEHVVLGGLAAKRVAQLNALVPEAHDYIVITYVTVGNGIGEIETVVFKSGGASGDTVATLTLGYDVNDKLSTVTRT